ncbi:hypothetical protein Tco_0075877 [Tanacetum coccineum]
MIFLNPFFDSNDDFTFSDNETLPEEDVPEENVKIYSNPLLDFDDDYISSDVNPLFNEVFEDIESMDSYVSKLDEPALLVKPLFDTNKDECFDPRGDIDEIKACLTSDSISLEIDDADFDPEGDILLLEKLLSDDTSSPLPPKELYFEGIKVIKSYIPMNFEDDYYDSEGETIHLKSLLINDPIPNLPPEVFLYHDPKILNDEPNVDDLKIKENVRFTFEDRHYLSLTFVIKIFLPFLTYSMNSLLLLSSRSEDTIFDPGISAYIFYSLEPVAYRSPMMIFPFFHFCLTDKGIRGESS